MPLLRPAAACQPNHPKRPRTAPHDQERPIALPEAAATVVLCLPCRWKAQEWNEALMALSIQLIQDRNQQQETVRDNNKNKKKETTNNNPKNAESRAFLKMGYLLLSLPPPWEEDDDEAEDDHIDDDGEGQTGAHINNNNNDDEDEEEEQTTPNNDNDTELQHNQAELHAETTTDNANLESINDKENEDNDNDDDEEFVPPIGSIWIDTVDDKDDRIPNAFHVTWSQRDTRDAACCDEDSSFVSLLEQHQSVLYLKARVPQHNKECTTAIQLLRLGAALVCNVDRGCLGFKAESAGLSHDRSTLLDLVNQVDGISREIKELEQSMQQPLQQNNNKKTSTTNVNTSVQDMQQRLVALKYQRTRLLYRAFVVNVTRQQEESTTTTTAGMQYLGAPDIALSIRNNNVQLASPSLDNDPSQDPTESNHLYVAQVLCEFACYLLHQDNDNESKPSIHSGQTFSLGHGQPCFRLHFDNKTPTSEEEDEEDEDDIHRNPFGMWRLEHVGVSR